MQLLRFGLFFTFSAEELLRRGSFAFKEEAWLASPDARVSRIACEPCVEKVSILNIAPSGCSYVLPACLQYYHESCPLGWEEHQIDDACSAPESYEGSQKILGFVLVIHLAMAGVCAKSQSFRGATLRSAVLKLKARANAGGRAAQSASWKPLFAAAVPACVLGSSALVKLIDLTAEYGLSLCHLVQRANMRASP